MDIFRAVPAFLIILGTLNLANAAEKPNPKVLPHRPPVAHAPPPPPPTGHVMRPAVVPQKNLPQHVMEVKRYYAVPVQILQNFSIASRPIVEGQQNQLALVQLTQSQVLELSGRLHALFHNCGGFSDLTVIMQHYGVSPMQALNMTVATAPPVHRFDKVDPSYPDETKKLVSLLDANRMWKFLAEFSSFPNRSALKPEGAKAAQWLVERSMQLASAHQRTDVQPLTFPTGGQYVQPSVAIRIVGADSKLPGILIGGHMDTLDGVMPGADDDGSGSATVMEVYNAILDSGMKFKRDIYFAYYAAEERGLVGSKVMVAEFKKRGIPLRSVLHFDMTGFKSPKDNQEIYMLTDHVNPDLTKFVAKLATAYAGIPVQQVGTTACGYSCSDHASWTSGGYSSALPFEASFNNDNKAIHSSNDKMNIMSQAHAASFMRIAGAYVVETADPISRR